MSVEEPAYALAQPGPSQPGLEPRDRSTLLRPLAGHPVLRFCIRRVAAGVLTLFVASILIFLATNALPGNVAETVLGKKRISCAGDPSRAPAWSESPAHNPLSGLAGARQSTLTSASRLWR